MHLLKQLLNVFFLKIKNPCISIAEETVDFENKLSLMSLKLFA